jgi:hypothetical protein
MCNLFSDWSIIVAVLCSIALLMMICDLLTVIVDWYIVVIYCCCSMQYIIHWCPCCYSIHCDAIYILWKYCWVIHCIISCWYHYYLLMMHCYYHIVLCCWYDGIHLLMEDSILWLFGMIPLFIHWYYCSYSIIVIDIGIHCDDWYILLLLTHYYFGGVMAAAKYWANASTM